MNITEITEIAGELGFSDLQMELQTIEARNSKENCPLVIPLVGEFSSGKTTLINSLRDGKGTETATEPTTSTIYEVHFGAESCHAKVIDVDGNTTDIESLSELNEDVLRNAKVVTLFDTSKKVPSNIILVDTPGLSSPDPRHKQTLVDFLPQADAILLVADVNPGVTRSLLDFVKSMSLLKKPIYLILTRIDTKPTSALEGLREFARKSTNIDLKNICCVSGKANKLEELYRLLDGINLDKSRILKVVNEQRVKNIGSTLLCRIDALLSSTHKDIDAEEAIRRQKCELDRLKRNIDKLLSSAKNDIEECGRLAIQKFDDTILGRLDSLVAGSSNNFDADAVSAINSTSSIILSEFKQNVGSVLRKKAKESNITDDAVNLHSLSDIDLSQYSINGLNYNLNLNGVGHEYDGYIAETIKLSASVAMASAGGASAGTVGKAGAAAASKSGTLSGVPKIVNLAGKASKNYSGIQGYNDFLGQQVGAGKGLVESVIGLVNDKTWAKYQRRNAIHRYMDNILLPEFKSEISRITSSLTELIRNCLYQEASCSIEEMTNAINELQSARKEKTDEYNNRVSKLKEYKKQLSSML